MAKFACLKSTRVRIAAALSVLALATVWFALPRPGINHSNFQRIKAGMTQADVEALMGCPPGDYSDDNAFLWAYGEGWGVRNAGMDACWTSNDGLVSASFDANGLVNGAQFQPIGHREQTFGEFLTRFWRRFGI
jgi:hypothetical protein